MTKVATDVVDVACQQGEGVGIEAWVDCLGKVDDFGLTLPVKDVVSREISMDVVVG